MSCEALPRDCANGVAPPDTAIRLVVVEDLISLVTEESPVTEDNVDLCEGDTVEPTNVPADKTEEVTKESPAGEDKKGEGSVPKVVLLAKAEPDPSASPPTLSSLPKNVLEPILKSALEVDKASLSNLAMVNRQFRAAMAADSILLHFFLSHFSPLDVVRACSRMYREPSASLMAEYWKVTMEEVTDRGERPALKPVMDAISESLPTMKRTVLETWMVEAQNANPIFKMRLQSAVQRWIGVALNNQRLDLVESMLLTFPDTNISIGSEDLLTKAASSGNVGLFKFLCEKCKMQITPNHVTLAMESPELADYVISRASAVGRQWDRKALNPALKAAMRNKRQDAVKKLLAMNVPVTEELVVEGLGTPWLPILASKFPSVQTEAVVDRLIKRKLVKDIDTLVKTVPDPTGFINSLVKAAADAGAIDVLDHLEKQHKVVLKEHLDGYKLSRSRTAPVARSRLMTYFSSRRIKFVLVD